jgi:hypothetical protein
MKVFRRTLKSPVTLLPVDPFQRHLLSALSGVAIFFIATYWGFHTYIGWWHTPAWVDDLAVPSLPLLQGLAYHLAWTMQDILQVFLGYNSPIGIPIYGGVWNFFDVLPSVLSVLLAGASIMMLLGTFKLISHPTWMQKVGPTILAWIIISMLFVAIIVPPGSALLDFVFGINHQFGLNMDYWFELIKQMVSQLVVPTAVLLVGLVPIFAPDKKVSKR